MVDMVELIRTRLLTSEGGRREKDGRERMRRNVARNLHACVQITFLNKILLNTG